MPMFPELRELLLLSTTIGPGLARGLDFDTLVSLRFRDCHGLPGFFATLVELRVQPKIKAFEIYSSNEFKDFVSQEEELKDAVMRFLGSFSGLTDLALRLTSGPWFPKSEFWSSILAHRSTLQNCVLDELWGSCWSSELASESFFLRLENCPSSNPLGFLDVQCLGVKHDIKHLVSNLQSDGISELIV
jgi:hypothetical protein